MTPDEVVAAVQALKDREAIRDCLATYCRAIDRMDRELLLSVYHSDAVDDHGLFLADRETFADQAMAFHRARQTAHQHVITNHTCELDGDMAHTETYWMFAGMNVEGAPLSLSGGRYIDRFERRDGHWAIAARLSVADWHGQPGPSSVPPELRAILNAGGEPARDRTDPSYRRPLTVRTPVAAG